MFAERLAEPEELAIFKLPTEIVPQKETETDWEEFYTGCRATNIWGVFVGTISGSVGRDVP
jgi:hypothetical protein